MKTKIFIFSLIFFLGITFSGVGIVKAQTQEELVEQYKQTLMSLIELLIEKVNLLQLQILEIKQQQVQLLLEAPTASSMDVLSKSEDIGVYDAQLRIFLKNYNNEWAWQGVDKINYNGLLDIKLGYRCFRHNSINGGGGQEYPNCDNPKFIVEPINGENLLLELKDNLGKIIYTENIVIQNNDGLFSISFSSLELKKKTVYLVSVFKTKANSKKLISSFQIIED
jgi:hypothetical protein